MYTFKNLTSAKFTTKKEAIKWALAIGYTTQDIKKYLVKLDE